MGILAFSSTFSSGTAMYPIYWNGAIFVGQDTLALIPEINRETHHCKMFANDKYVLATAGTLGFFHNDNFGKGPIKGHLVYSLDPPINEIFKIPLSPDQMVNRIMKAFEDWQRRTMLPLNEDDRKLFAQTGLAGYLFWFDKGVPMTQYFEVNPVVKNGQITFNHPVLKGAMTEGVPLTVDGPRHRAIHDPGMQKRLISIDDGFAKIDMLLRRETELSGDAVGPPFTIFRLSMMGGNSWMSGADVCKVNTHLTTRY
jgi:hypothetical protein